MNTVGGPASPRRVELGLFLPIVQPINRQPWEDAASPAVVLDIARHAESVGLDFVTVQDHGAIAAPELDPPRRNRAAGGVHRVRPFSPTVGLTSATMYCRVGVSTPLAIARSRAS